MATDWNEVTFGQGPLRIIDGDRGKNYPSQHDFSSKGDCLFLNAGNVTNDGFAFTDCAFITREKDAALGKGKLERFDIVLTTRGTVGNVAYFDSSVPFDSVRINSGMVLLRSDSTVLLPRFLYFFVRSALFKRQVNGLLTGSAQPQLPIRDINRVRISLPRLQEQSAIADLLGLLDDKINLNRKMSAALEAIAQAFFQSWFINFNPVKANIEKRETGLSPELSRLFPGSIETTEHGQKPVGWTIGPLTKAVHLNPTRAQNGACEAPYLDMANAPTKGFGVGNIISRKVSSGSRFRNGDTLLARITPCLENGKTTFVDFLAEDVIGWGSTEFIVMRSIAPLPLEYSYLLARSEPFRDFAISKMTGSSGRQRVPTDSLHSYVVVIPDAPVAEAFGRLVTPLFERISAASRESRTLSALRDALLPKLISGELRVRDAERILEKSA